MGPHDRYKPVPGRDYEPSDAPLEKLQAMHSALGIDRAVIIHPLVYGYDHSATLDALAVGRGAYRGIAAVDDRTSEGKLEAFHEAGIRGVRFHFFRFHGKAPELDVLRRTCKRIARLGWHVLIHIELADIAEFGPEFLTLEVPFVIDHMGYPLLAKGVGQKAFQDMLELMQHPQCWAKISSGDRHSATSAPYADAIPFVRAMAEASPNRTIWGTNWPHVMYKHMYRGEPGLPPPDEGDLMNLLWDGVGSAEAVKKILVDNPDRLYGFDPPRQAA